jgi:hypothetical protein
MRTPEQNLQAMGDHARLQMAAPGIAMLLLIAGSLWFLHA